MGPNDSLREAFDGEMLEANLAIGLASCMNDDEISWMTGFTERFFDALIQRLGDAHERKAVDSNCRTVGNGSDGLRDGG